MAQLPTDIKSLARSHTKTALRVLAKIMTEDSSPHASRVAAAQYLLDRGWGKAIQALEVSGEVVSKVIRAPSTEADAASWTKQHVPEHMTEH